MIVLVTGVFPIYRNGIKVGQEFVASHGVDLDTGRDVVVSSEHPEKLGARFDRQLQEWVLDDL